jgi:hypothetical protein
LTRHTPLPLVGVDLLLQELSVTGDVQPVGVDGDVDGVDGDVDGVDDDGGVDYEDGIDNDDGDNN